MLLKVEAIRVAFDCIFVLIEPEHTIMKMESKYGSTYESSRAFLMDTTVEKSKGVGALQMQTMSICCLLLSDELVYLNLSSLISIENIMALARDILLLNVEKIVT